MQLPEVGHQHRLAVRVRAPRRTSSMPNRQLVSAAQRAAPSRRPAGEDAWTPTSQLARGPTNRHTSIAALAARARASRGSRRRSCSMMPLPWLTRCIDDAPCSPAAAHHGAARPPALRTMESRPATRPPSAKRRAGRGLRPHLQTRVVAGPDCETGICPVGLVVRVLEHPVDDLQPKRRLGPLWRRCDAKCVEHQAEPLPLRAVGQVEACFGQHRVARAQARACEATKLMTSCRMPPIPRIAQRDEWAGVHQGHGRRPARRLRRSAMASRACVRSCASYPRAGRSGGSGCRSRI